MHKLFLKQITKISMKGRRNYEDDIKPAAAVQLALLIHKDRFSSEDL